MKSIVDKLRCLRGTASFDTAIETGDYGLTADEDAFLTENGYYGKPVTERALALIAVGLPFAELPGYHYYYDGMDGVSECAAATVEEMQRQFIGCYYDGPRSCHNDCGSRFSLPENYTWDALGLIRDDGMLCLPRGT